MAFQPEPNAFYKVEELAQAGIAGIHTIRKWIKDGRLQASRVGRAYMISGENIRIFLMTGTGAKIGGVKKKKK